VSGLAGSQCRRPDSRSGVPVRAEDLRPRGLFAPHMPEYCGLSADSASRADESGAGDPSPSAEDLSITRRLVDAGQILNIRALGDIIVGRGQTKFFGLRESGMANLE